jgi:hypothetical protein
MATLLNVACAICAEIIPAVDATAGMTNYSGQPVFACAMHLTRGQERAWLCGWVRFMAYQRQRELNALLEVSLAV